MCWNKKKKRGRSISTYSYNSYIINTVQIMRISRANLNRFIKEIKPTAPPPASLRLLKIDTLDDKIMGYTVPRREP